MTTKKGAKGLRKSNFVGEHDRVFLEFGIVAERIIHAVVSPSAFEACQRGARDQQGSIGDIASLIASATTSGRQSRADLVEFGHSFAQLLALANDADVLPHQSLDLCNDCFRLRTGSGLRIRGCGSDRWSYSGDAV